MDDCHLSNSTKLEKKQKTNATCFRLQVENSHMLFLFFFYIASQKITRHVNVATGVASSRHTDSPHLNHFQESFRTILALPYSSFILLLFGCCIGNNPHIGKWSFPLIPHFPSFQSLCPFGLFCLLMVLKRFCHPTDPQPRFLAHV